MKIPEHHQGLIFGSMLTVCCLVLTFTFIVPIVFVLPGVVVESIASHVVNNDPYSNVGICTIIILCVLLTGALMAALLHIRRRRAKGMSVSQGRAIVLLLLLSFIIHPLGFYIYWGVVLQFRSDGQLIFAAFNSFPFSSFAFPIIGFLMDWAARRPVMA
jgi:hypothetical protein